MVLSNRLAIVAVLIQPHAARGPLALRPQVEPASNPPATKPRVALRSSVSLQFHLCAEQH